MFDHKMEASQMQEVTKRTDVVSYALLAEINHFHNERTIEIQKSVKRFLEEQVKFYQNVSFYKYNILKVYYRVIFLSQG